MANRNRKAEREAEAQRVRAAARRKQMIFALILGAVVGLVLSLLTEFWLWLPSGLVMGLATGAIMKPPGDEGSGTASSRSKRR